MASGVIELIDQLMDTITDAKSFPLSGDKCIIERGNALDFLDEIKSKLPKEISHAKQIVENRQELIDRAEAEAEEIKRAAAEEAARIAEQENVVRLAKKRALEIVEEAEKRAEELRRASNSYADETLRKAEEGLSRTLDSVRSSRLSFRNAAGLKEN